MPLFAVCWHVSKGVGLNKVRKISVIYRDMLNNGERISCVQVCGFHHANLVR